MTEKLQFRINWTKITKGEITYDGDDEHVKASIANSIVVLLLHQVNDMPDEDRHNEVDRDGADEEETAEDDGAALAPGVADYEFEGAVFSLRLLPSTLNFFLSQRSLGSPILLVIVSSNSLFNLD